MSSGGSQNTTNNDVDSFHDRREGTLNVSPGHTSTRQPTKAVVKHSASFCSIVPESTSSMTTSLRSRLAEMTIDKLRFDKVGIVGRDTETSLLREAYQNTMRTKGAKFHRSLVLIDGAAGTGKSRLAEHTLKPLVTTTGGENNMPQTLLLQGKQLQHGQKLYAAITDCCEDLTEQVMTSFPLPKLRELQTKLNEELDFEGPTLITILPALAPLLGTMRSKSINHASTAANQTSNNSSSEPSTSTARKSFHVHHMPEVRKSQKTTTKSRPFSGSFSTVPQRKRRYGFPNSTRNYEEAKQRFNHAFRRFIRVICGFTSIVFLIDDLQWCDESSFHLLETLLHDKENSGLLLVGTVRGVEVQDGHEFAKFHERMQALADKSEDTVHVLKIAIGNLNLDAMVQMLEELLSLSGKATILPLAQCVHAKTLGNAFYTVQFLTSLRQQKLLKFNFGALAWTWDIEEIGRETTATDNVADLVRSKMEMLPCRVKNILPLMASLGSLFHLELFCMVLHHVRATAVGRNVGKRNQGVSMQTPGATEEVNTNAVQSAKKFEKDCQESNMDKQTHLENMAEQHPCIAELMTEADTVFELNNHATDILMVCQEEGLIEMMPNDCFRWIHDKVEEAALTMVPEDQLENMQFELATSLVDQMNDEEITQHISILVYLFRTSQQRLSPEDCLSRTIVHLKLESGLLALQASSFLQAASELATGIEMLSQDAWEQDYDVCLELYSTAAEVNVVIGNFDCVDKFVLEVEMHTEEQPLIHRRRAYDARVRRYLSSGRDQEAVSFLLDLLRKVLNKNFAKRGVLVSTIRKLLAARKNVQANVDTLMRLPFMCDEMKEWTMYLLDNLIRSLYQSAKAELLPLAVLTALELTLNSGLTEVTPTTLVGIGGLICAAFPKHFRTGVIYGEQAVHLLDTMDFKRYEARTCFAANYLVLHHSHHIRDLQKGLLRGYHSGMAHGDSDVAGYCMSAYLQYNFEVGAVCESLVRDCKVFVDETEELRMRGRASVVECVWQSVLNLQGKSQDPLVLTGDVMSEVDWVANNRHGPHWELFLGRYQLHVAVILGEFERAMEVILKYRFHQRSFEKSFVNSYAMYWLYFHMTIAAASMVRRSKRFRYFRKLAQTFGKQIVELNGNGNPNLFHRLPLVVAELADLKGQRETAAESFQKSIASSTRSGFRMDCVMAHERYADFLLRQNDWISAKYHYNEAILVCAELGITLKAKRLQYLMLQCNN